MGSNGVNSPPSPGEHGIMGGSKSKVANGDIFRLMRGELRSHLDGFSMTGGLEGLVNRDILYDMQYRLLTTGHFYSLEKECTHESPSQITPHTHTHLS